MEMKLFEEMDKRAQELLAVEAELRRITAAVITNPIESFEAYKDLNKAVKLTNNALALLCRAVGYTSDERELRERFFNIKATEIENREDL